MAKFDSNRIQPGTISFTRDATTGEFKIQQQGFLKLPDLSLPTIDQADYDTGDGTTTPPDSDTSTPEKTLPFIPGGDDKSQPMMDVRDVKKFQPMDEGQVADASKQFSETDIAYKNYEDTLDSYSKAVNANRNLLATGGASPKIMSDFQARENQAKTALDQARANVGMSTTGDMKVGATGDLGFDGPDRGIAEPSKSLVDPITGVGRSQSQKFKTRFDPTKIQPGTPVQKNLIETTKDLINNSATVKLAETGMKAIGAVAVGVGDALLGVTDVDRRRREADSSAAKSLGLKTVGELGGSTDPGRIAMSPNDHVFGGMNRDSAKGNLSESGAKRVATRMSAKTQARIAELSPERQKAFNDKTKEFQDQLNDFNSQKEAEKKEKSQNPNLRAGAGKEGGGNTRVICTDLHRTGELSTKDWIRDTKFTFKQLSKKHVKGYLLWAEPTVKHIQKYPRYRKLWKHFAQHRANDIAWRLNEGKFDLLGRIYAGIGEPLCWLLGNFVSDKQINKYNILHWRRI